MIQTIYVEEEVKYHKRTLSVLNQFPKASRVLCHHYGEIFNVRSQNFRLQKKSPALILARKAGNLVLDAPAGYGIGGKTNYYFSHMLNCLFDCRYCFLQGLYRSANYVMFVNYEDFRSAILKKINQANGKDTYFFSGYDCDSLAFDSVTNFVNEFIPFFEQHPTGFLELRTKSVQMNALLNHQAIPNCIVAFSMTPAEISQTYEAKVPSLEKRLEVMGTLQEAGWPIGLRIDPVMYHPDFKSQYKRLFAQVFGAMDATRLHSVSLGPFRLPKPVFENMYRLYPDEKLFSSPLKNRTGMMSYGEAIEKQVMDFCLGELTRVVPRKKIFSCLPEEINVLK
jgi:spore photoproduct lyase